MLCPRCQHENPTEAKFCLNCGTRLAQACPQCQQILPPEAKFCMACGHALTATSASDLPDSSPSRAKSSLPARPAPEAERRQLTVMFCDLAESTQLSGQLDPEDLRTVIRAYQETAAGVIQRYEGHIAQYLGDGLLVYFGWPQAHEDDAQRAVHVGLGIIEAMEDLNPRLQRDTGVQLTVRIGIHTGLVVIGEMGGGERHEQLALGETTNLAARLEGLAQPNSVVISYTTYRLVEGYFRCDDLGAHALKGVADPMQTYRVRRATGLQGRLDVALTRGLTPLIGREQEVGLILERWAQVVQEGHGQVMLLSGEAGIGKSRLVQVLKDQVAKEAHTRWECRSSPYYQSTALYPITDLLQRTLRAQDDSPPEEQLRTLEQELCQYRVPLEESVPLFASLLSLSVPEDRYLPLHLSPQRQRQKTLEYIVSILLEQAEKHPILFILEDLHWTDPTTLDLLDLLIDQTPTASILILLTYRPEFQPSWSTRSYLTQMTLNRLTRSQIERMVEQVVGGKSLAAQVVSQITEKTDGVPLYIEEMTKAVLESGALTELNGQYDLSGSLPSLTIPATLQDSLMARLDRLVTAKAVAQYAAVIGRQFSYELLQAVSELDDATLQRELSRLVKAELVYQRGLPPQASYMFKHALIQDAAYESLLKSARQQYHHRIGQVLEDRFPERVELQPELIAHHYTEAGLHMQAVDYWQKAGQQAIQRSAHQEATQHLTTGLALLDMLPETPERTQQELQLNVSLGETLMTTKGYAAREVEQVYTHTHELCRQVGDSPQLFHVLGELTFFHLNRGAVPSARELGDQGLSLARRQADPWILLWAHLRLGMTLFWLGELVQSREHVERSMALYNAQPSSAQAVLSGQDPGTLCLSYWALILWLLGYPDQAVERSHAMHSLTQQLARPFNLVRTSIYAARLHHFRQEGSQARDQAETAMTHATEHGFSFWLAEGMILRGGGLSALGHAEEGIVQMQQGLAAYRATGAELNLTFFLALLSEAYSYSGQPEAGLAVVSEALGLRGKNEEGFYEAELHRLQGGLLLKQAVPDESEAETCFHQALDIARRQHAKSWELRAATSLARLWQQQGKNQDAHDLLEAVYDWFTEGFDTADLQEAKQLLDDLGR